MKLRITGGCLKGRWIQAPKTSSTRPTSERLRQAFFDIIGPDIIDASFIDGFAGSGAMGIEAYSRGAHSVYMMENNHSAIETIKNNLHTLGIAETITLYPCSCHKGLQRMKHIHCSIGYFDPPYPKTKQQIADLHRLLIAIDQEEVFTKESRLFFELPTHQHIFDEQQFNRLIVHQIRKMGDSSLTELRMRL